MEKLKGKTILIGKEPERGRLLVAVAGNAGGAAIGTPGSVPSCVSRCKPAEGTAHAKLTVDGSGNMTITNLKPQNVTYVNGSEISSKRIVITDAVELGKDRYAVSVPVIVETARKIVSAVPRRESAPVGKPAAVPSKEPAMPQQDSQKKKFNITHLRGVWDRYEKEIDRITVQQQDAAKKRMLPIMAGSLSGVASPILATLVTVNTLYITVPVAALSFALYFANYRKKDTSYEDRKTANEKFTDEYVCPNPDCNKFLGNMSYKLMKKQFSMQCPHCKCEFVEK